METQEQTQDQEQTINSETDHSDVQERVRAEIALLETGAGSLLGWSEREFTIVNETQQKDAEDLIIGLREAYKAADEKRKDLLKPVNETKERIQALFKPYLERLEMARGAIGRQLSAYHLAVEKAKEEARQLIMAQEPERMAEARETGEVIEPLTMVQGELPQAEKTSRTHMGRVTYRDDVEVTIVDVSLIPRDLMMPDMPRIKTRAKSGMEIPGVVVTKKVIPVSVADGRSR